MTREQVEPHLRIAELELENAALRGVADNYGGPGFTESLLRRARERSAHTPAARRDECITTDFHCGPLAGD